MERLTTKECRDILGDTVATDADIKSTQDDLERVANALYDEMSKRKLEEMRWAAYAQAHPEDAV